MFDGDETDSGSGDAASCCTVLSGASILFLVLIGIAFERNVSWNDGMTSIRLLIVSGQVEVLTGSTKFEGDGKAVAKNCYAAAIVYACFIAFCGMQVSFWMAPSSLCLRWAHKLYSHADARALSTRSD